MLRKYFFWFYISSQCTRLLSMSISCWGFGFFLRIYMNVMPSTCQAAGSRGDVPLGHSLGWGWGWGARAIWLLSPQKWIWGLISQCELCFCEGGFIQACWEYTGGGCWGCPRGRGCDMKAARNFLLALFKNFSPLKILIDFFLPCIFPLFPLCHPFFALSLEHTERNRAMEKLWWGEDQINRFPPADLLDPEQWLMRTDNFQGAHGIACLLFQGIWELNSPQIPEKGAAQVPG